MIKANSPRCFTKYYSTFEAVSYGFYMRHSTRLLFAFITYGILAFNVFQLITHPYGMMEQPDEFEIRLDFGDEESELEPSGACNDNEDSVSKGFGGLASFYTSFSPFFAQKPLSFYPFVAIRQSQINLQKSCHRLPIFLLHQSYQGYLSLV